MKPETRKAFERMRDTEMALNDLDYLHNTPKLHAAMRAAEDFRIALELEEQSRLTR